MKYIFAALLAVASTASAHYTFPELVVGSTKTGQWNYVRKTANYQSNGTFPITSSIQSKSHLTPPRSYNRCHGRCYPLLRTRPRHRVEDLHRQRWRLRWLYGCIQHLAPWTPSILPRQGSGGQDCRQLGWKGRRVVQDLQPRCYLLRWPDDLCLKRYVSHSPIFCHSPVQRYPKDHLTDPLPGKQQVSVPLPKSLPSGEYLMRVEHIALHSASAVGGAQFYISCAQIKVENGGNGTPGPKVAFPGAYKATDPGIQLNIYYPVPTSYVPPGPAVWSG
jgi:hypothetical protein